MNLAVGARTLVRFMVPWGRSGGLKSALRRPAGSWREGEGPILRAYAAALEHQVQEFDLEKLPKTLQEFSGMGEKLANL